MNISAAHLSVQHIATSHNVGGTDSPKLSTVSSTNLVTQPVVDGTSNSNDGTVNPTYEKPIPVTNTSITPENQPTIANKDNTDVSAATADDEQGEVTDENSKTTADKQQNEIYSESELALISELKSRDSEVIAHERAHASVGGQHTGSPSYSYKTGPDGVKYAVSGEVSIDTSTVPGDPQATLQKAQQIKAAALAPAEPSGQDRKVAAKADQMATQARNDILQSNSGGESEQSASRTNYNEATVPEHFTGHQNLSIKNDSDFNNNKATQNLMNERSFHINEFYQNSSNAHNASKLNINV